MVCLVVIFISFVGAFRNYNGPQLTLSNLSGRPGSSIVTYFDRMRDGDQLLNESFKSVAAALERGSGAPDLKPAIDSVERGIRAVMLAPRIDPQADQYRARLLELLTQQKNILSEFDQSSLKNRDKLSQEQAAVRNNHGQFQSDYRRWLPGFLKEHGYAISEGNDG
jgi:hypothetical protein